MRKTECYYCDAVLFNRINKTKDHIIPKVLGGSNHHLNKIPACLECNGLKSNYLPRQLADVIQWFYLPQAETLERKDYLRKVYERCIMLEMDVIPRHKEVMMKNSHQLVNWI